MVKYSKEIIQPKLRFSSKMINDPADDEATYTHFKFSWSPEDETYSRWLDVISSHLIPSHPILGRICVVKRRKRGRRKAAGVNSRSINICCAGWTNPSCFLSDGFNFTSFVKIYNYGTKISLLGFLLLLNCSPRNSEDFKINLTFQVWVSN